MNGPTVADTVGSAVALTGVFVAMLLMLGMLRRIDSRYWAWLSAARHPADPAASFHTPQHRDPQNQRARWRHHPVSRAASGAIHGIVLRHRVERQRAAEATYPEMAGSADG